ncbi:nitroreductase family protein [Candidatus Fermentibacterales bacterium]|nr:nitroreductase family protein [Candidatus Fermentibacterales bacterium]
MTTRPLDRLLERSSLRRFADRDIEPGVLDQVLEAGVRSASAGNLQPWSAILVRDPDTRNRLASMCFQEFMADAPLHLLFCLDMHRNEVLARAGAAPYTAPSSFRHFWVSFQDVVIAAQSMCTAADMLGLGSVYIGTIMESPSEVREMFSLPSGVFPVVLVCMGYPREGTERKAARKFSRRFMIHEEKYSEPDPDDLWADYQEREAHRLTPIGEKTELVFRTACANCVDEAFAEACMARARGQGGFNEAQRRFGLHYRADGMPCGNLDFVDAMREAGMRFFERWEREDLVMSMQESGEEAD